MSSSPQLELAARGNSVHEQRAFAALQSFMKGYGVVDLDLEPQVKGFKLTARRANGQVAYSAWGSDKIDTINNMVRCVTK